jgi:hypothetical protein
LTPSLVHQSIAAQAEKNRNLTAIITGANSGIGFETAKACARAGMTVVMGMHVVKTPSVSYIDSWAI